MQAAVKLLVVVASGFSLPAFGRAPAIDPLQFFEGRTESSGTIKIVFKKAYASRSFGLGRREQDGSLSVVQRVQEDGKPERQRRWRIRQVGPGHFTGTMSDAAGKITIDEIGGRYRFRFKLKDNLSVEQWVSPLAGGQSATNSMTVRKFGMTVATGEGIIRKIGG
jgi:hypothetical protein